MRRRTLCLELSAPKKHILGSVKYGKFLTNIANFPKYGKIRQIWQISSNMVNFVKYGKFCQIWQILLFLACHAIFGKFCHLCSASSDYK